MIWLIFREDIRSVPFFTDSSPTILSASGSLMLAIT